MLTFNQRLDLLVAALVAGGLLIGSCIGCAESVADTPCAYLSQDNLDFLLAITDEDVQKPNEPKGSGYPIRHYRLIRIREMVDLFGASQPEAEACMDYVLATIRPTVSQPSPDGESTQ